LFIVKDGAASRAIARIAIVLILFFCPFSLSETLAPIYPESSELSQIVDMSVLVSRFDECDISYYYPMHAPIQPKNPYYLIFGFSDYSLSDQVGTYPHKPTIFLQEIGR
jgi:hypothetical protein